MITEDICAKAWDMISPAVAKVNGMGITNKYAGTVVVFNPNADPRLPVNGHNGHVLFEARIVNDEISVSDRSKYTTIAIAKAEVSFRTGLPSRQVQQESPHLYKDGDTKWGGSVVRNGLIVAFSGVQAVFDEMIAGWMADAIIALCRNEMTKPDGVMASESSFILSDGAVLDALGSEAEQRMARTGGWPAADELGTHN